MSRKASMRVSTPASAVGIQLQGRFGAHDPLQIMQHERIRCARKLEIKVTKSSFFRSVPAFMSGRNTGTCWDKWPDQQRKCQTESDSPGRYISGNTHISVCGKGVVGASQDRDDRAFGTSCLFQSLFAKLCESVKDSICFCVPQ